VTKSKTAPACVGRRKEPTSIYYSYKRSLGNDLLSQGVAPQVPSALADLTTGFGMGPGVSPPLESPRDLYNLLDC
jgi:hypothetical protein